MCACVRACMHVASVCVCICVCVCVCEVAYSLQNIIDIINVLHMYSNTHNVSNCNCVNRWLVCSWRAVVLMAQG